MGKFSPYSMGNQHITQKRIEILNKLENKIAANVRGGIRDIQITLNEYLISRKHSCFILSRVCRGTY